MSSNFSITVFALVIIVLIIDGTTHSVAAENAQIISPQMNGLLSLSEKCCSVSSILRGNIQKTDGITQLSLQNGTLSDGPITFHINFKPTGNLNLVNDNTNCSSGSSFEQPGNIELVTNNGTILKGQAYYVWGSYENCSGENYDFTYFGGKVQNIKGDSFEFYTASDLIPRIK